MEPTAISIAARALKTRLASSLPLDERYISIGHPAASAKQAEAQADKQYLNVFFFQIEHGGYPSDATSADQFYVRLHCLITAFGNSERAGSNMVSAGENDLRLIGGVMAALHRQPTLNVVDSGGKQIVALQIVPSPFSLENINNIWATQLDTSYRISVAYELALAPIPLAQPANGGRLVGMAEVAVTTIRESATDPIDWKPEIAFYHDGEFRSTLSFALGSYPDSLHVAVAGRPGEVVTLIWEIWDATVGWHSGPASEDKLVTVDAEILDDSSVHAINPGPTPLAPSQRLLFAVRTWTTPTGEAIESRSNPLLVSAFLGNGS